MSISIVTGASGFIGKKLVQKLAKEQANQIVAVVRNADSDVCGIDKLKNVEILYCEMQNIHVLPEKLKDRKIDYFFHLAWEGSTGSKRTDHKIQMENMLCAIEAFKAAEALNCDKFLCAGTISERILDQAYTLDKISQNMIYAQAKKSTYEFLKIVSKNSPTKLVWMQFSNVYGPENKSGNLISYTVRELSEGRIPEYGSGRQPYNFIYIDDLIQGICCLARAELSRDLYFIGSGEAMLLKDYLNQIPKAMNMDVKMGIGKRPDDGIEYKREWFDISDIKNDTHYASQYTFEKGIRAMCQERNCDGGEF